MTKTCEACDAALDPERDKAGGSYHAKCLPCLQKQAAGRDKHAHTCEQDPCSVCLSWRAMKREQAQPYLLERAIGGWENETLDSFR
jgi:hypothetical protein